MTSDAKDITTDGNEGKLTDSGDTATKTDVVVQPAAIAPGEATESVTKEAAAEEVAEVGAEEKISHAVQNEDKSSELNPEENAAVLPAEGEEAVGSKKEVNDDVDAVNENEEVPSKEEEAAELQVEEKKADEVEASGRGRRTRKPKEPAAPLPVSPRPQRERKSTDRFSGSTTPDFDIKQGNGIALKDIPHVNGVLSRKSKGDEILSLIHSVLFGKRAKAAIFKKNILSFSGFPEENKEEEIERAREKLTDTTKDSLANFIHLLGLPSGGKKDEQIERILEYLVEPHVIEVEKTVRVTPKGKRTKKKAVEKEDEEEEEEEEDYEEERPVKKQRTQSSGKRKAPPTANNLRSKIRQLAESGVLSTLTVEDVIKDLSELFSGELEKKKETIQKYIDDVQAVTGSAPEVAEIVAENAEEAEESVIDNME